MQLNQLEYSPIKDKNQDVSMSQNGLSFFHLAENYDVVSKNALNCDTHDSNIQKIITFVNLTAKAIQKVYLEQIFDSFYKFKAITTKIKRSSLENPQMQERKKNIEKLIQVFSKIQKKDVAKSNFRQSNRNGGVMKFCSTFQQKIQKVLCWSFRQMKVSLKLKKSRSTYQEQTQVQQELQSNQTYKQILEILSAKRTNETQTAVFQMKPIQQIAVFDKNPSQQDQLFALTDQSKSSVQQLDLLVTKRVRTASQNVFDDRTNTQLRNGNAKNGNKLDFDEVSFQKYKVKSPQIKVNKFQVYFTQENFPDSEISMSYDNNLPKKSQIKIQTIRKSTVKNSFLQQKFKTKINEEPMKKSVFDCSQCEYCKKVKEMKKLNYQIATREL